MNNKYLINILFGILIIATILGLIGIYINQNYNKNLNNLNKTCDKNLLRKINNQTNSNNKLLGYNIIFSSNVTNILIISFLIILSSYLNIDYKISSLINPVNMNGDLKNIKNIIIKKIPIILIFIVFLYKLILTSSYKQYIIDGVLNNQYYFYNYLLYIFIFIKIIVLFKYMNDNNKNLSSIIYLLSVINIIILVVININLKFFYTDG